MGLSDQQLQDIIGRITQGDKEAFGDIVDAYQDMLLSYAAFRVPDRDTAEEIVHLTFIRVYDQLSGYRPGEDFGVWLRVIARYMILTEWKTRKRERERLGDAQEEIQARILDHAAAQAGEAPDLDAAAALRACLDKLGGPHRELLRDRYENGLSPRQLAERLRRTETWVTTVMYRIRKSLKACMERNLAAGGA